MRTRIEKVVIQAFCFDDKDVPHPASQVAPDRDIDEAYEGEVYRCIAGSHMQVTIAQFRDKISFEGGQTLTCQKGEALYHIARPGRRPARVPAAEARPRLQRALAAAPLRRRHQGADAGLHREVHRLPRIQPRELQRGDEPRRRRRRDRLLVCWIRSSPALWTGLRANFESEKHTRNLYLLVSGSIPKFDGACHHALANFGIGTLAASYGVAAERAARAFGLISSFQAVSSRR